MNWFMLNKITLHDMLRIDHKGKEWKGTIGGKLGSISEKKAPGEGKS